jgi:hypothetical protein
VHPRRSCPSGHRAHTMHWPDAHWSVGLVLGTHLFVATFAQSPWQSHLQHPTWVSRRLHSSGFRGQPSVLHCVRSFMPVHACSCVGIWHMSVAPVLGTHLFVVTFVQSPSQSHLSRLKVGYGMGGWVGCVLSEHRVGNPRFFSNTKQRSSLDGWGAKVDKNDVGKGGSTYS